MAALKSCSVFTVYWDNKECGSMCVIIRNTSSHAWDSCDRICLVELVLTMVVSIVANHHVVLVEKSRVLLGFRLAVKNMSLLSDRGSCDVVGHVTMKTLRDVLRYVLLLQYNCTLYVVCT